MTLIPYEHHAGIFAKTDPGSAASSLLEWGRHVGRFRSVEHKQIPFENMWKILEDRRAPTDRAVLVRHGTDWTAFFDNNTHEHLSSSIGHNLCRLL